MRNHLKSEPVEPPAKSVKDFTVFVKSFTLFTLYIFN